MGYPGCDLIQTSLRHVGKYGSLKNNYQFTVSATGTVKDKVEGFENWADDYLTKRFYFEELLTQIGFFIMIDK